MPREARATQPKRRFGPEDLAALARDERRKLVQLLLDDAGPRVVDFQNPAAYDELILEVDVLWQGRRVRLRIADRVITQEDVDRLTAAVRGAGDAQGVLIAPLGTEPGLECASEIHLIDPAELILRFERSALIAWPDRRPAPSYERVAARRALSAEAALLDPVGLQWLPTLALNELPAELGEQDLAPQDLFERVAFRLFTSALRFGGERYGEAARGRRLPDAALRLPGQRLAALLDCKASADGYMMESDHFLRFAGYVKALRADIERDGDELRFMIVLSSAFAGTAGERHPYHHRAQSLREETGLQLVYLRAGDLAQTATVIEARGVQPAGREALDWASTFGQGQVSAEHLEAMLGAA
jgi:hypothetical protein